MANGSNGLLGYGHAPRGEFYKALAMDALIKEVQKFITEETKIGVNGLAKLTGYTPGVISPWLKGTYTGDVERVKTRIIGAMELYRERAARHQPERYVPTDQSESIEAAIVYTLKHKQPSAVLADSGCGKSMTARHVAAREFGLIYVACDCNDFRQSAFLDRIASAMGMGNGRAQSSWKLQRQIQERLTDTEWCLVIDDAHYLLHPQHPSRSISLDVVKDLHATAGTPFVLLAVPELWTTIAERVHTDWYAQLKRRIALVQRITRTTIQADDVERIVESLGAKASVSVLKTLMELARDLGGGGYGNVEKAVRWAMRFGAKQVTIDSVKQYLAATSNVRVRVNVRSEPPAVDQAKHAAEPAVA